MDNRCSKSQSGLAAAFLTAVLMVRPTPGDECGGEAPGIADLVLTGGQVLTADSERRIAEAIAVVGNRNRAIGTEAEITERIGR